MAKYKKKNGKYYRLASNGSWFEVKLQDGYLTWRQPDGLRRRAKLTSRNGKEIVGSAENKPRSFGEWFDDFAHSKVGRAFSNATIGASVAEAPAVQTANGWHMDDKGDWKQDPDSPGARYLQKALPVIGATGLASMFLPGALTYFAPGTAGGNVVGAIAGYQALDETSKLATGKGIGDNFRLRVLGKSGFENPYLNTAYLFGTDMISDPTNLMTGGTSSMIRHTLHAGLPAFMLMARRTVPAFSSKTGNELVSLSRSVPEVSAYHGSGINWPREWGIPEYSRTPKTSKTTFTSNATSKGLVSTIGEYSGSNPMTARAYPERYFDEGVALRFGFGGMNGSFGFKYNGLGNTATARKRLSEIWNSSPQEGLELVDRYFPGRFSNEEMSLWADMIRNRGRLIDEAIHEVRVRPDFTIRTEGLYNGKPLILEDSYIPGMDDLIQTDYGAKIVVTPELVERYGGATYDAARGGYVLNKPKLLKTGGADNTTSYTDTNEIGNWLAGIGRFEGGKPVGGTKTNPLIEGRDNLTVPYRGVAIEGVDDASRYTPDGRESVVGTTYITPQRKQKR